MPQAHKSFSLSWLLLSFAMTLFVVMNGASAWASEPVSVIRGQNGGAHFAIGNTEFIPVGVNYLAQHVGPPYQSFDMFDAKTFNVNVIDHDLKAISDDGYNTVRLWLKGFDPDRGFDLGHGQISDAYANNVIATLQMARHYHLHVILTGAFKTGSWLPVNYLPVTPMPTEDVVGGMNRLVLIPEMAEATGQFYHDLLAKIAAKDPSLQNTIFYFDLYCELHFDMHQPPFSQTGGDYRFNGRSYDMASASSRQELMDIAAQSWMRTVGDKVKSVDSNMLVTASSFFLAAYGHTYFDGGLKSKPGSGAAPYPLRPQAMIQGGANLIDIHVYPSPARPVLSAFHDRAATIMEADGIAANQPYPVPLIAGEFGPGDSKIFSLDDALAEMAVVRNLFCPYHFTGYMVWSWLDTDKNAMPANDALSHVVAPKYHPQFCGQNIR